MTAKLRVVVVGNGMVGHRFCSDLTEHPEAHRVELTVIGDEPRAAYDRVQLTHYFDAGSVDPLMLAEQGWHEDRGISLHVNSRVTGIDRGAKTVVTERGDVIGYDVLVLSTGSTPFVPPLPGRELPGVFVYRTIEDLDAIRSHAENARSAAVIGGGLLGLEAARAVQALGLDAHVVDMSPRLLSRQLDASGGKLLERAIRGMGIGVHLGRAPKAIVGDGVVRALEIDGADPLSVDMVIISAGIRPRDELARASGLKMGERGGIDANDWMQTSDESIYAIGECVSHRGMVYGLVAPGYEMAKVAVDRILGGGAEFHGADLSTKLKMLGTDVASFGDPFAEGDDVLVVSYQDLVKRVYKKVLVSESTRKVLGGVLVGDTSEFGSLVKFVRSGEPLKVDPDTLILPGRAGKSVGVANPDAAIVCSCNGVSSGEIREAIRCKGLSTLAEVKKTTCAGTGCGGCLPQVNTLLQAELAALGQAVSRGICEHFDLSRTEIYALVLNKGIRSFEELLASHGRGLGCEVCKPTVASVLASVHNDFILEHATLQDTNDRFLANIQRQGTYSVVPRIPGGEITPERLIVIGQVAKKYGLYTKITGGQRIDLFGARVDQLPDIWEELIAAGFESGHAYGKSLRTVKSCVGSTWCRYGVQDSVGFAIRVENRYKGLRSPHKLKSAVSGCIRECAEARGKDFGLIATERGYNLYVCGNGGAKPRHADLLASDLDEATAIRFIDRFLMYYVQTADRLMRTSTWLDQLAGGIDQLRAIVVEDSLGIGEELERRMQGLVDAYACEWTEVVTNPEKRAEFRHFANSADGDDTLSFVVERGQKHPSAWSPREEHRPRKFRLKVIEQTQWVRAMPVEDVPTGGGVAFRYGRAQLAVFHVGATGEWFATENACPHTGDQVLARGLVGDQGGVPKVACPHHKKTFDLRTGECMTGESYAVRTFPVKIEEGVVYLELPPASAFEDETCSAAASCSAAAE